MTTSAMTPPPSSAGSTPAELLERRSYKTYLARLKASERLALRNKAWNASLVALTTSATIGSVGMLSDGEMYGSGGDTLLVCVSILTLVASLVTSGLDYSGRSRDMFINYRKVQRISVLAEAAKCDPTIDVAALWDDYHALMDESENHTAGDYYRAERQRALAANEPSPPRDLAVWWEDIITYAPFLSLAFAAALAVPLVIWFF